MADLVVALFEEAGAVLEYLRSGGEVSFLRVSSDLFRKALLIAAASNCEARLVSVIKEFIQEMSPGTSLVSEFVRNKALEKQYHTLFDWDAANASSFFRLFGVAFRDRMKELARTDEALGKEIKAFLEVGQARNRLVHQNFASFTLEKTPDEILELYRLASGFLDRLPSLLRLTPSVVVTLPG